MSISIIYLTGLAFLGVVVMCELVKKPYRLVGVKNV